MAGDFDSPDDGQEVETGHESEGAAPETRDPGIADDGDTPEGTPTLPDLSFLDDDLAATIKSNPGLTVAQWVEQHGTELRRHALRSDDYTRKTTAHAELVKKAKKDREDADAWRTMMADDRRRQAVLKVLDNPGSVLGDDRPPKDPEDMTTAELLAWQQQDTQRRIDEALARATRQAPKAEEANPDAALDEAFREATLTEVVTPDEAKATAKLLMDDFGDDLTPDVVLAMAPRYLKAARRELATRTPPAATGKNGTAGAISGARAASPRGGRSASAPAPMNRTKAPLSPDQLYAKILARRGWDRNKLDAAFGVGD